MSHVLLGAPSRRTLVTATFSIVLIGTLVGCGGSGSSGGGSADGDTSLTMWVRSDGSEVMTTALVDAYNDKGGAQIDLTVVPSEGYQQKVGAAAGSNSLPDLLAADVVYSPNYTKQGVFVDITDRVENLSSLENLSKAHIEAASRDEKIYGVPHNVDSSVIVYNKDLYAAAGLDPEDAPTTFSEVYEDAKAIRALGGETYGFYFAGNCAGCNAYTMFPYASAAGYPPITDDGTKADFDNEALTEAFALYKRMVDEDIVPSSAEAEDGSTWTASFKAGQIGILPAGSFLTSELASGSFDWGVASLMAPDGSATSTFVGGDMAGITRSSENVDAAWAFLEYTLSDEAQVQVVAKNGGLPSRVDLADNEYTSADPRIQQIVEGLATGYTPSTLAYGELINSANGPWLTGLRAATFGDQEPSSALEALQSQIQDGLDSAN